MSHRRERALLRLAVACLLGRGEIARLAGEHDLARTVHGRELPLEVERLAGESQDERWRLERGQTE